MSQALSVFVQNLRNMPWNAFRVLGFGVIFRHSATLPFLLLGSPLVSGPNKGKNCFLITLNILLSLLKQSFSIEIVWQITKVIVKSCEQLHLVDPVIYSFPAKAILLWHFCFFSTELVIPYFYIQIFLIVVNLLVDWELIP